MYARAGARDVQQGSPMLTRTMWVTPFVTSALRFTKYRLKCPRRFEVSNTGRPLPAVTILQVVITTGWRESGWIIASLRVMRIGDRGDDTGPWSYRVETHNPDDGIELEHCFGSHLDSVLGGRGHVPADERGTGRPIVVRDSRAGALPSDVGPRSAAAHDARLAVVCRTADDSRSGLAAGGFLGRTGRTVPAAAGNARIHRLWPGAGDERRQLRRHAVHVVGRVIHHRGGDAGRDARRSRARSNRAALSFSTVGNGVVVGSDPFRVQVGNKAAEANIGPCREARDIRIPN